MKTLNATPIVPVFAAIGSEVSAAHRLLIEFEQAINQTDPKAPNRNVQIQGFDLALQILSDVETLIEVLGQQFSTESALPHPLPLSGVRLERVRAKLSRNPLSDVYPQGTAPSVDLF